MRIALAASVPLNKNTGMAGVTWRLGQAMRDQGADVDFYFMDELKTFSKGIPDVMMFPWRLGFAPGIRKYDVVDSSGENIILSAFPNRPLLVARSHGLEHVAHVERLKDAKISGEKLSWMYPLYRGSIRLWEEKTAFRRADLSLLLNEYDRNFVVDRMGVDPEKARVVPNGLAESSLQIPFDENPDVDGAIKIAWVGSYIPRKGVRYAEPAIDAILRKHPHVSMSFLGTGGDEESILQHYDASLRDRIRVIPKFEQTELFPLLKGHSVYLFPSLSEGFPVSPLEAMANGMASVVTDIPGPTEFAKDGENALVVPARDSKALEGALDRLIGDAALRSRLRASAYETARRYSWTRIAAETLSLYEEGLKRRKKRN